MSGWDLSRGSPKARSTRSAMPVPHDGVTLVLGLCCGCSERCHDRAPQWQQMTCAKLLMKPSAVQPRVCRVQVDTNSTNQRGAGRGKEHKRIVDGVESTILHKRSKMSLSASFAKSSSMPAGITGFPSEPLTYLKGMLTLSDALPSADEMAMSGRSTY
ncbi:hypothetical protein MRB53_038164 [Persea americana]|nr:hypothetical protein MRB53_038164 [Persea americana]